MLFGAQILRNGKSDCLAMWAASAVLPLPGGPVNRCIKHSTMWSGPSSDKSHNLFCQQTHTNTMQWNTSINLYNALVLLLWTTTVLRPFFRDHPGEPVPEENFWTLWCNGRLIEADTRTIRLGATPSRLTSAHLHQSPYEVLTTPCQLIDMELYVSDFIYVFSHFYCNCVLTVGY